MNSLATMYALAQKNNPARQRASMTGEMIKRMPDDKYGYGAVASIPLMAMYGKEAGEADRYDQQLTAGLQSGIEAEQKAEKAKRFTETFKALAGVDKGAAVRMWNELAGEHLGIDSTIDSTEDTREMTSVHFTEGGWWGIDKRTGKLMIADMAQGGQWRSPTQQDMSLFQKTDRAVEQSQSYAEGAKSELRDQFISAYKQQYPGSRVAGVAADINLADQFNVIDRYGQARTRGEKRIGEIVNPKPEKQVEKTVDLGDKVEYIYTDGSRETKPKGRAPKEQGPGDDLATETKASNLAMKDTKMKFGITGAKYDPLMQEWIGLPPGVDQSQIEQYYQERKDYYLSGKKPSPLKVTPSHGPGYSPQPRQAATKPAAPTQPSRAPNPAAKTRKGTIVRKADGSTVARFEDGTERPVKIDGDKVIWQ